MTPQARKANTEALLEKEGIPFLPSLPCVESEAKTRLRSAEEVGIRIACLFGVVGSAFHVGDTRYKEYLRERDLWDHLTPEEISFLSTDAPERKSVIKFTWRCEALFLLMWAANLFDAIPLPCQETDTGQIVSRLPGVVQSPWPFIRGLRLRRKSDILDASDLMYRLHWATRQAGLDGKPAPCGLIDGVVYEWHHAINWITRYDDQGWDKVSTDT
jgi:hypothetical protein